MPNSAKAWHLRLFAPSDGPQTVALFRETVRRVNFGDYTLEQTLAWAPDVIDVEAWTKRFLGRYALVAEADGKILGFGELEDDGHLDRFYVHADYQGQGVGGALLTELCCEASRRQIPWLYVEASITARPFFERFGFIVSAEQTVECRGVRLTNFRMRKPMEREKS